MKKTLKKVLSRMQTRLSLCTGYLLWGGIMRGVVLASLWRKNLRFRFNREWRYAKEQPNFYSGEIRWVDWHDSRLINVLLRGVYAAEVVAEKSKVLDIGCGDGWYDYYFLSGRASSVDAVDILPEAIAMSKREHSASNIHYKCMNAIKEPFPNPPYDLCILDGALGHISSEEGIHLLSKIRQSLTPKGFFVGSEALEKQETMSWDHKQCFPSLEDLRTYLKQVFPFVLVRQCYNPVAKYNEAFFRCCVNAEDLKKIGWI